MAKKTEVWDDLLSEKGPGISRPLTEIQAKAIASNPLKKYPSPRPNNPVFTVIWNATISNIARRRNFGPAHLFQVKMYCDLYAEYESLSEFIAKFGATTNTGDVEGLDIENVDPGCIKKRPEYAILERLRVDLLRYHKALKLDLASDQTINVDGDGSEHDDFS